MNNFKKLDKILGWAVFFIALTVYALTMEKTGSLWDCGEFLSCTYKLQVAHPPGAPFFMILGKLFSLLAMGDVSKVAMMINLMSAVATAFCSLFFFWSSTMLLRMALIKTGEEIDTTKGILILGTSFLAGMAATFLDSMWFNALEGEVYALSVFFMAFNVWAILKWNEDNSASADKWLLLIAVCTGMSIGVHLLSLLVFPMITLVYYMKKFKTTLLGLFLSFIIGLFLIEFVMIVVLSMTTGFIGKMDLFFVNSFHLPFYSGSIVAIVILVALFAFLIKKSANNKNFMYWNEDKFKVNLNTVILFFAFIFIGYTSYFMVVIRANANTPINMNVPDNFLTLKTYIDRDQYGQRPLTSGPDYTNVGEVEDYIKISDVYTKNVSTGEYDLVGENKTYKYNSKVKRLFPRMAHEGDDKKAFYRLWINPEYDVIDRATGETVQTFPKGQSEQAEQFANQKNATAQPGQFVVKDKLTTFDNIKFFINYQLGFMYFRYMMWNFSGRTDDLHGTANNDEGRWISGIPVVDNLLGELWGNAKLDQTNKPEILTRNKAHNQFYMIPFLLCLLGAYYCYKKDKKTFGFVLMLFFATGIMQIIFHNQPPIEPRERDYVTAPSFWAFALWMPFGAIFIYEFFKNKLKISTPIVSLAILAVAPILMGTQGWDDHDRGRRSSTLAFAKNMLNSCPKDAILFSYGDNDTYPLWYAQEIEGIRTDVRVVNTSLIEGSPYIGQLRLPMNQSKSFKLSIPQNKLEGDLRSYSRYKENALSNDTLSLQELIDFMTSDDPRTMNVYPNGMKENFIPTTHVYLNIDREKLIKSGLVTKDRIDQIPARINFEVPTAISRGTLIQLDLIANNLYDRAICFASSSPSTNGLGLKDYMQLDGMVIKFTPSAGTDIPGLEAINTDDMYKMVKSFDFGKLKNNILLDDNTIKSYYTIKSTIASLALNYAAHNDKAKTEEILGFLYENMPAKSLEMNSMDLQALQAAEVVKSQKYSDLIKNELFKNSTSVLDWITNSKNIKNVSPYQDEIRSNIQILSTMKNILSGNPDAVFNKKITDKLAQYENSLMVKLN